MPTKKDVRPVQRSRASVNYCIPVLQYSLNILECLQIEKDGMSLTELHRRVRIPKTTTFRILETLIHRSYVSRAHDGRYHIAPAKPHKRRFGILCGNLKDSMWEQDLICLQNAADENAVELVLFDVADPGMLTRLKRERVDLAVLFDCNPNAVLPVTDALATAKIPTLASGAPVQHAVFVGIDDYRAGWKAGELLVGQALATGKSGRCHMLCLQGQENIAASLRLSGARNAFHAMLPSLPTENICHFSGDIQTPFGRNDLLRLLRKIPGGEPCLVVAPTQVASVGMLEVLRRLKADKRLAVVGFDLPASIAESSSSPFLGAISLSRDVLAKALFSLGGRLLSGHALPPYNYIQPQFATRPHRVHEEMEGSLERMIA